MIRLGWSVALAGVAMFVMGSPAYADVIEINPEGAHWVVGGNPEQHGVMAVAPGSAPAENAQPDAASTIPAGMAVPMAAVADPSIPESNIPEVYRNTVLHLAAKYDLSPALLEALVWQESRWNYRAVSSAGARGLGQLMPGTARDMGVNPDDPFANLEGATRYLRIQLDRFGGDVELALAAYNAGPGRVIRARGVPRIRETQLYVAAIMGRLSNYSRSDN